MPGPDLKERIEKEFLAMPLRPGNMTFYSVRTSILRSVKAETKDFHGSVLDVGCGFMPYRELIRSVAAVTSYTGMDLEQPTYYADVEPDLKWDGKTIPVADASFDCVMATEFLEHYAEPDKILAEIHRVLKPGGVFFATVPFIWNLHEVPYDEYRYTPYSLERLLRTAGYTEIRVKALGGWNAAVAQMIGLWTGFSPLNRFAKPLLRYLLFPFYYLLLRTDRVPESFDGFHGSMFPGLSVTARR